MAATRVADRWLTPVVTVEVDGKEHVLYSLQPKQLECYNNTPLQRATGPTHIGYGGAAGGAKSHTARAIATAVAQALPGSTTIIFRRTRPEVHSNHWVKFKSEVPDFGGQLYTSNATDMTITWHNGSRTVFGYLERDDHVFRYQGSEYDCIIFEEATHYSWFQVNWLVSNRLRSVIPGSRPFAIYLSNPGGRGHFWFKRLFIDKKYEATRGEFAADFVFTQAHVYDNKILCEADPAYVRKLEGLDEPWRSWLLRGDFTAGAGQALNLNESVHLIQPFVIPAHWPIFRSYDWGFAHPFSFGWYAVDERKNVICLDTLSSRNLHDQEVVERVFEREQVMGKDWEPSIGLDVQADILASHRGRHGGRVTATYTVAGHDCWSDIRSKVENMPTTAETFGRLSLPLQRAAISRVAGYRNFRDYIRHDPAKGIETRFTMMRTPGNLKAFDQLSTMVQDPDFKEDVLKVDADDYGEGGDDSYDEKRYALNSRPIVPKAQDAAAVKAPEHYDDRLDKLEKIRAKLQRQAKGGRAPLG